MRSSLWQNLLGIASLVFVLNLSSPVMVSAQADSCATSLPPRLTIGNFGRVTAGNSNNVRDTPSKSGNLVGKLPGGESFKVLDGPKCADGLNWWQVRYQNIEGWTVEAAGLDYWLDPYDPSQPETLSPINDVEYSYEGISFELNPDLATKVTASHRGAVLRDPNVDVAQAFAPAAVELTFTNANGETLPISLRVYSVADFIKQEPFTEKTFARLHDDVVTFPDWKAPQDEISVLSIVSQPQLFRARVEKLRFSNGAGYHFLTKPSFDVRPIINPISYRYSGITYDSAYYVVVEATVTTNLLPDKANPPESSFDFESHFEAYRDEIVDQLTDANSEKFTPNLYWVDDLIQSLQIHGPSFKVTADNGLLHAQYDDIAFDVPADYATDIDYRISPASWGYMNAMPEHVCFGLQANVLLYGDGAGAVLCIIPTEGMDEYVERLNHFLDNKPTLTFADRSMIVPVPIAGVRQRMQAQVRYLESDFMRGVRFVASYSQMDWPIGGKSLSYNFSGLTQRGSYIIFLESRTPTNLLPVTPLPVPNALIDTVNADPQKYYQGIVDRLNAGSSADFSPNLETLDAIVLSIRSG